MNKRLGFVVQRTPFDLDRINEGNGSHLVSLLNVLGREAELRFLTHSDGLRVLCIDDIGRRREAQLGWSQHPVYRVAESAIRRLQSQLGLPYLALFESLRVAEACRRELAGFDYLVERNTLMGSGVSMAATHLRATYILLWDADPILERDYLGQPLLGFQRRWARRSAMVSLERADLVVCVSENARQWLIKHWKVQAEKVFVLPNGVDTERFSPRRRATHEADSTERVTIGFSGSFWPWHDLRTLVEAFSLIVSEERAVELKLVGDGIQQPEISALVSALGLDPQVDLVGAVAFESMPGEVAEFDIGVVPIPAELKLNFWGSPMKLFEYMAAGKPIVASRVGQVSEVVEGSGAGLLVEPGDAAGFAAALRRLVHDRALRELMGLRGRRYAETHCSWPRYAERLHAVMEEVAAAKQHTGASSAGTGGSVR